MAEEQQVQKQGQAGPSASVVYAGFALLAILFIAVIAYNYSQLSAIGPKLDKASQDLASTSGRLSVLEGKVSELQSQKVGPATLYLLYDSSCAFCDNEAVLQYVKDFAYESEPSGLTMVAADVKDKLSETRSLGVPFLPAVLLSKDESRKSGAAWDLTKQETARGPVFTKIEDGWYSSLRTSAESDAHPVPVKLLGDSCKQGEGKLVIDYFYAPKCPQERCGPANATLSALRAALGGKAVVRERCLPDSKEAIAECATGTGYAAANESFQLGMEWGVYYSPTFVYDCAYTYSSASLSGAVDKLCLLRPELCSELRTASIAPPAPAATAVNTTNRTNSSI